MGSQVGAHVWPEPVLSQLRKHLVSRHQMGKQPDSKRHTWGSVGPICSRGAREPWCAWAPRRTVCTRQSWRPWSARRAYAGSTCKPRTHLKALDKSRGRAHSRGGPDRGQHLGCRENQECHSGQEFLEFQGCPEFLRFLLFH